MIKQICISLLLVTLVSAKTIKEMITLFGTESTKDKILQIQKEKYPYLTDVKVDMYGKSIVGIKLSPGYFNPGDKTHTKQKDMLAKELFKLWGKPDTTNNTKQNLSFFWVLEKGDTVTFNVDRTFKNKGDTITHMYHYHLKVHNRRKRSDIEYKNLKRAREEYRRTSVKGTRSFDNFNDAITVHQSALQGIYYYYMKEKRRKKALYTLRGMMYARFTVKSNGELLSVKAIKSDFPDDLNQKLLKRMSEISFPQLSDAKDTSTFDYRLGLSPGLIGYYESEFINKKKK